MQIGKFRVTAAAAQNPSTGQFHGRSTRIWDDGDATLSRTAHFDAGFDTEEEAIAHAIKQTEVRIQDGVW